MASSGDFFLPESVAASGRGSEKLSLPTLQSKMKCDPESYESELQLLYRHFDSSLFLFQQNAALNSGTLGGDPNTSKELGDMAMFLAHVLPFYPKQLAAFPKQLVTLMQSTAHSLPSALRQQIAQALILIVNRKMLDIGETLALFMGLQVLGDRVLRKLAFSHVVHSIRLMNKKHRNDATNRSLQNILFAMLQEDDESRAKRSLIVLCDLHRRKVWFDERTANAVCTACFHASSRIMIAALSFLLGYERIEDSNDSDGSSSEDDATPQKPQVVISREAIYKAQHTGTVSSRKKKKAKIQRAMRSLKKQQRTSSENTGSSCYSPLTNLKDAQGFVEKLFARLQKCNERFEVKMMMVKVIARAIGLHRLVLLNFYPFLQKYVQPHQRDVTDLLAAAIQACHDMVPPDAVEPLFRQIVNQFVHDRSRTEAIAVGLNAVREICLRIPLLMTEELLQDLVLYKKSHEKAVSSAARSLITLFREVCPSLLVKKDRGRPSDPKARPKAFGEVNVSSSVPGVELLQQDDSDSSVAGSEDDNADNNVQIENEDEDNSDGTEAIDVQSMFEDGEEEDDDDDDDDDDEGEEGGEDDDDDVEEEGSDDDDGKDEEEEENETKGRKRKFSFSNEKIQLADQSLRALKKLAGGGMENVPSDSTDGILSNEDFQLIRELKAKKEAELVLAQQGLFKRCSDLKSTPFKIPSSEHLSEKRMDPAKLEANIRRKLSKEERLALVKAGREERGKYQARAAVKQKKSGGLSNRQKEHKKAMPLAAKRSKIARSRQERKKQDRRSGKQFRGKKAWK